MVVPIIPKYTADAANTAIDLGRATIELKSGTTTVASSGTARLDLSERGRVIIEVDTTLDGFILGDSQSLQMKFGPFGRFIPVIVIKSRFDTACAKLWLMVTGSAFALIGDHRARLSSAIVHILNFPEFYSFGPMKGDFLFSGQRLGRVVLRNADWQIELQALPSTSKMVAQLKAEGGNAITHVARITRADDRSFTRRQLDSIVHDLHRFLSFARGSWTSLFGTVGFDRNGTELYTDWSQRIASPWHQSCGWFDHHHGEFLTTAFPGFLDLLHDPAFSKAGYTALYWYLRSNRAGEGAGVDGGLILSQAALEGLSISILQNAGVALPKGSNAADRIRAASLHLKIRTAIPRSSSSLRNWQRRGLFLDGPEAVTKIRNDLVHPNRRLPGKLSSAIIEAWQLAQWYIEIMLLKLCKYKGFYSRRLQTNWVGQIQRFP